MRLRPSGNKGPVATSWSAFTHYQENEAWVWEHLALTRARGVTGEPQLMQNFESFRRSVIARQRSQDTVLAEVVHMRDRLAAAKSPTGVWDAKTGAGRMMDIELVAQAGALLAQSAYRDVAGGLEQAVAGGWLDAADALVLQQAYALYWSVQTAARLLSGDVLDQNAIGEGGALFLSRSAGYDGLDHLEQALQEAYKTCAAIISRSLQKETGHADAGGTGS